VETVEIQKAVSWVVGALFVFALYSEVGFRHKPRKQRNFTEGQDFDVAITLVSTDAKALACWSTEEANNRHCQLQSPTEPWAKPAQPGRPAADDTLAPYKTTDDELLLISGLFQQPALRERLNFDPPTFGVEHVRFVANCKLRVEGKLKEVNVRWATNGTWQPQKDVPFGGVSSCWLSDG
jgi:hypothetical protein